MMYVHNYIIKIAVLTEKNDDLQRKLLVRKHPLIDDKQLKVNKIVIELTYIANVCCITLKNHVCCIL